jgi:hypothetical protein
MKSMQCPCGQELTGNTDAEFIAAVNAHLDAEHPEMSGKYTDEMILSRAQEV